MRLRYEAVAEGRTGKDVLHEMLKSMGALVA